jgi:acyl-CoA reductase-like NAD-dependent aldehyde dehydrogenase
MSTAVSAPAKVPNYINGEWVESTASEWLTVVNPATADAIATVPLASRAEQQQWKWRQRRFRPGDGLRPKIGFSPSSS